MIKLKNLLIELTNRQKEAKKDYLFKQTGFHSSNKIPLWTDIWKEMSNSDRIDNEILWMIDNVSLTTEPVDKEELRKKFMEEIEYEQKEKYLEIINQYKELDGKWCWRNIILPSTIDPKTLPQLGVYWAIREDCAEAHWAKNHGKHSLDCIYQALIELKNIDWTGTLFARMNYTYGDDEQEIRFMKNSPLLVRKVNINNEDFFINNRRRA
jgi:hypothetical protein